jgi:hypothetical protein
MGKQPTSPVVIQRRGNKIEVEMRETGDLLAWCWIGDDSTLETIADILSAKRLGSDADKLRQMAMDARRYQPQAKQRLA